MGTEVALLEWVNTFALTEDVNSLSELADGHILWDILRDLDPTYFTSSLPETRGNSTKWVPKYENLKHVHKALVSYISEECDQTLYAPHAGDGLKAIAQRASTPEFRILFQLVLQATIFSPRQHEYILKMTSLTSASQQSLKDLIEDREVVEEPNGQQDGADDSSTTFVADPELEFEERFGKVMAENERILQERKDMQIEMRALDDRLIRLQDNNDALQQRLTEAEDHLQTNGTVRNGAESDYVKDLESKIKQQENDFADQENRVTKQTRKTEALLRKIDNLERSSNSSAKKAQEARDELDEVKRDRDALSKKANMVDKFKQQLQASNNLKKENDALRNQLEECRYDADALAQLRRGHANLQTELEEFKKLIPTLEGHNAELSSMKRQLELDNQSLYKEQKEARATIAKLNQRGRSSSISSVASHDNDGLEGEFPDLTNEETRGKERISSLEKQNKQLEDLSQGQASKILSLERMLDELNSRPKQNAEFRRPSFTSSASTERLGSAQRFGIPVFGGVAQPAHSMISTEVCQKLRKQLDDQEAKGKEMYTQLRDKIKELDVAKKDRRSLLHRFMNADEQHSNHLAVAYVAMDKLEMIAQVKADNSTELQDLRSEHTLLQEINERLESENREQKAMLSESSGQNAPLQDHPQLTQEIKDLTAAIKAGKELEDHSKAVDAFSEMIMQGRKELVETQKVYHQIVSPVLEAEPSYRRPTIASTLRSKPGS
ncbi:MAG: hypothetical protein Q9181_004025 [Wetmoreana brouardii]